jgi:aryl-alcohol dehydrogenase-like predicted oxidoreductase
MKYRQMGGTGLMVSRICLGAMTFGTEGWGCDQATAKTIVGQFVAAGGNFIDTADTYSGGRSEQFLGTIVKEFSRDDLVIATKCYSKVGMGPNDLGLSRKHIIAACEASLRRLQIDYIDLYQIHGPDPRTPYEETMRAMDDLVRQGKVRYIGCSNLYAWQIMKANTVAALHNLERFSCAQHMYNLVIRDVEREILPVCADQGLGFICWSPLASGLLTGKYQKTAAPEAGSRIAQRPKLDIPRFWHERGFQVVEAVAELSKKTGKSASQVALAWLLGDRRVTAVICGVHKPEQLAENLAVGEWELPGELRSELSEAAFFEPGYPHSWIENNYNENYPEYKA